MSGRDLVDEGIAAGALEWCGTELPDEPELSAEDLCAHDWAFTGAAYGGDDESYHGEGRVYCQRCGADGDA